MRKKKALADGYAAVIFNLFSTTEVIIVDSQDIELFCQTFYRESEAQQFYDELSRTWKQYIETDDPDKFHWWNPS